VFSHEDTKTRRHEGFEILEPRIERMTRISGDVDWERGTPAPEASDRPRRNLPFQPRPSVKSVISVVKATAVFSHMCRTQRTSCPSCHPVQSKTLSPCRSMACPIQPPDDLRHLRHLRIQLPFSESSVCLGRAPRHRPAITSPPQSAFRSGFGSCVLSVTCV
jgi:hypothetical protein